MDSSSQPIGMTVCGLSRRSCRAGGFTLAEVMMAAAVFLMAALGLYTILIKSYQLAALARYRDDARAVLRTFADQFERLQTADGTTNFRREIFMLSDETGQGLKYWDSSQDPTNYGLSNETSDASSFANGSQMTVTLGGSQNGVTAHITRKVQAVNPGPNTVLSTLPGHAFPSGVDPAYAAGNLWLGTFTITYRLNNRTITQSLSVLRAAP